GAFGGVDAGAVALAVVLADAGAGVAEIGRGAVAGADRALGRVAGRRRATGAEGYALKAAPACDTGAGLAADGPRQATRRGPGRVGRAARRAAGEPAVAADADAVRHVQAGDAAAAIGAVAARPARGGTACLARLPDAEAGAAVAVLGARGAVGLFADAVAAG